MPTNYLKHPGPPNGSEVWEVGQSCIDTNGAEWVCTARGSANQPGTAFLLCSEPDTIEFSGGDLTGTVAAPTIAHIAGNNSTANFIIANVPIPASGQTIITSASIGAGTWLVACTVSASVNAVLGSNAQEIALVPHGGAASVAYASAILGGDLAKTEEDLLIYALYPATGEQFLKWKYGIEPMPDNVKPPMAPEAAKGK